MGAWEELVAGQIFDSIITPLSTLIGTEVLYLILWGSVLGIMMVRSKSWGLVGIAAMLTSFIFVPEILPSAQGFLIFFVVGALVYTMYNVFKKR